ncbi:Zinc finger protein STP4 [Nakaseomyces bracarensis]|uniref:Zinc finger protein STP4 n=1 Tax=Nakaseomyces bracarensis TaxID=273131 RepID=A0ABR4NX05_9SACH
MADNVCAEEEKPKPVTLPPISSFDNLIKAAEKQYMGDNSGSKTYLGLGNRAKSKDSFNMGNLGARNNSGILTYQFLSVSPFGPSRMHSKVDLAMPETAQVSTPSSSTSSGDNSKNTLKVTPNINNTGTTTIDPLDKSRKNNVPFLKPTWSSLNDSEPSSSQSSANVSTNISRSNSEVLLPGVPADIALNKAVPNGMFLPRHSTPENAIILGKGSRQPPSLATYPSLTPNSPELLDQQNLKRNSMPYISGGSKENSVKIEHGSESSGRVTKKRKRRECPVCHGFFANLTTHKATHLEPDDKPFMCPICKRGFVRQNDLMRHQKMHWKDKLLISPKDVNSNDTLACGDPNTTEKEHLKSLHCMKGTYECPYNSTLIELDLELYPDKNKNVSFETMKCHRTGVFSRCDTFKNHLKALHFEYPLGTKRSQRKLVPGKCKHCGEKFNNVEEWFNSHVGKNCGYSYH